MVEPPKRSGGRRTGISAEPLREDDTEEYKRVSTPPIFTPELQVTTFAFIWLWIVWVSGILAAGSLLHSRWSAGAGHRELPDLDLKFIFQVVIPKDDAARNSLEAAMGKNVLFAHLEVRDKN